MPSHLRRFNSRYRKTFEAMLDRVVQLLPGRRCRAFWPAVGPAFIPGKSTLYVGQAIGRWDGDGPEDRVWFDAEHPPDVNSISSYSDGVDFLEDVRGTFRSMMRRLQQSEHGHDDDTGWTAGLAWTNLFKVAPDEQGNPDAALRAAQFEHCRELLQQEIAQLRPRRVVVMTGVGWFEGFWPLDKKQLETIYSDSTKILVVKGNPRVVLAPHPRWAFRNGCNADELCNRIEGA